MRKLKILSLGNNKKIIHRQLQQPNGFVWTQVDTSESSPFINIKDRWIRICYYRGYRIAWVERIDRKDKTEFVVWILFPYNTKFNPSVTDIFTPTYEEAKAQVERYFLEFIDICK